MPISNIERQRFYRQKWSKDKHYAQPLVEFLRIKYISILKEYNQLYEEMIKEGSKKIRLTSTKAFTEWKLTAEREKLYVPEIILEADNDIISKALKDAGITLPRNELVEESLPRNELVEESLPRNELVEEIPIDFEENSQQEFESVKKIIEDITREQEEIERLNQHQEGMREYIETHDEGVDFDSHVEIEFDIEPFDFNIEVENYDFEIDEAFEFDVNE